MFCLHQRRKISVSAAPCSCREFFLLSLQSAYANNGFGGLTATGLTFGRTDAVAIVEEDLSIGLDRIEVSYVFRNTSAEAVEGEVIFPLPPLSISSLGDYGPLLTALRKDNLVNFRAEVDGHAQDVVIDRIAVIEPEWSEQSSLSQVYESPGRDVTAELRKMKVPLTLERDAIRAALGNLPNADFEALKASGIVDSVGAPLWSIILRYHWNQTFPPGVSVRVLESYDNYPAGGEFIWLHSLRSPTEDIQFPEQKRRADAFCITSDDAAAIYSALKSGEEYDYGPDAKLVAGGAMYTAYVLRTANSWAKPIGKFTLRLDKGDPRNLVFTCAGELKQVSPTSLVLEKEQYTPTGDLGVVVVIPADSWQDWFEREDRKSN